MPGKPPGWMVVGILDALKEGPLTRAAICRELGAEKGELSSVISRLNRALPMRPKRIYVKDYTHEDEGSHIKYPRARYALGDLPDAKKPKPTPRKIIARRWREHAKTHVASVFEFGMSRRMRAEHRQKVRSAAKAEVTL